MINTTAPFFSSNTFEQTMKRQQAELYCRLFAMMAEDFPTNTDVQSFSKELLRSLMSMQEQLTTLFQVLSTHTHTVPPHTHPIPPHTHVCVSPGSPCSPNVAGLATSPIPLTTNVPVQSSTIKWNRISITDVRNTTGATQNLAGSVVTVGPTMDGPLFQTQRRLKTPTILQTTTTVPPILKGPL